MADKNNTNLAEDKIINMFSTAKKLNFFLIFNLPSAFLCGVRVKLIDSEKCHIKVRHNWFNKNPFNSMFWAVQGMAAELSTGALLLLKIKQLNCNISMLVIRNEAEFTKKARGRISFYCDQGKIIDNALDRLIQSGTSQTIFLTSKGVDSLGDSVSKFKFQWTLKMKS